MFQSKRKTVRACARVRPAPGEAVSECGQWLGGSFNQSDFVLFLLSVECEGISK